MTTWECQCTSSDCDLSVELPEETIQELRNYKWNEFREYKWIIIVDGCMGSPPDGYNLLRRDTTYKIYSSDVKLDIDAAVETADIINDPEMMEAIRQGEKALKEGRFITLKQLEKELGLE